MKMKAHASLLNNSLSSFHLSPASLTLGAITSMDLSVSSRRKADVSANPVATCGKT